MNNLDKKVVDDFGKEWNFFSQQTLDHKELKSLFENYF